MKQDLSCPVPECAAAGSAMESHIFWTCPSARRHWAFHLDRWRRLGTFLEGDLNVWVFGLYLPEIPPNTWDDIRQSMDPGADLSKAQAAVFRQLESCGVLSYQRHFRPSGLSASAAWKTRLYHRRCTQQAPRLSFAGQFEGFVDQPTSPTWETTGNCLRRYGHR